MLGNTPQEEEAAATRILVNTRHQSGNLRTIPNPPVGSIPTYGRTGSAEIMKLLETGKILDTIPGECYQPYGRYSEWPYR